MKHRWLKTTTFLVIAFSAPLFVHAIHGKNINDTLADLKGVEFQGAGNIGPAYFLEYVDDFGSGAGGLRLLDEDHDGTTNLDAGFTPGVLFGIGNANPQTELDVLGIITATEFCFQGGTDCVDGGTGWGTGGGGGGVWLGATIIDDIYYDLGKVGIGTKSPTDRFSVANDAILYNPGASFPASQLGNTVTGINTSFNASMVGGRIKWDSGEESNIIGFINFFTLIVAESQTVPEGPFKIYASGFSVTSGSNVFVGAGLFVNGGASFGGAIKIGVASSPLAGTIQWTGADFEGYDGGAWQSLTGSGLQGVIAGRGGLEVVGTDVGLINTCANGEILKWNATVTKWECKPDETGGGGTSLWDGVRPGDIYYTEGKVGIDDTTPDFKFEVATSTASGYFGVTSSGGNDGDIFVIDATGQVGIGVAVPSSALDVTGDIAISGSRLHVGTDGNVGIGVADTTGYRLAIENGADEMLKITRTGANSPYPNFLKMGIDGGMTFNNNNYDSLVLKGGNIGIGAHVPVAVLTVSGKSEFFLPGTITLSGAGGNNVNSFNVPGADADPDPKKRFNIGDVIIANLTDDPANDGVTGWVRGSIQNIDASDNITLAPGNETQLVAPSAGYIFNFPVTYDVIVERDSDLFLVEDDAFDPKFIINKLGNVFINNGAFVENGFSVGSGNSYFAGNVGIGAAAPLSKLDVAGGVAIGSYAGVNAAPSNGLIISGNIGIGTPTPGAKLDVVGTIRATDFTCGNCLNAGDIAANAVGNSELIASPTFTNITVTGDITANSKTGYTGTIKTSVCAQTPTGVKRYQFEFSRGIFISLKCL